MPIEPAAPGERMRIDRLLWMLRLTRTRGMAQQLLSGGQVRMDGRRVERLDQPVGVGATLTLPLRNGVRVLRVTALPVRRGPPAEAAACYIDMNELPQRPAASESQQAADA